MSWPYVYPAPRGEIPQPMRSSGSDHKRSHIGPSCGTSSNRCIWLIWSSVSMDGDKPACGQKSWFSMTAASGKKSKRSVSSCHTLGDPYFRRHSS
eukprot:365788-Chlamydomonas_euryale.AAC.4